MYQGTAKRRHKFVMLHFGGQCPWNVWVAEQVKIAAERLSAAAEVIDAATMPEYAIIHRMFFPFLVVIDEAIRLPSPLAAEELIRIATAKNEVEETTPVTLRPAANADRIAPLTLSNIADTFGFCVSAARSQGCEAKRRWLGQLHDKMPGGTYGYVAYKRDRPVAAMELVPSNLVPYPITGKKATTAFITCIYPSLEKRDYRGQLLDYSLKALRRSKFERISVIAGRRTPYPNGPVPFFLAHGFSESCVLDRVTLREGLEELVLLEKALD